MRHLVRSPRLRRLPTLVHEQNAVLGRANRLVVGRRTMIATAFGTVRHLAEWCGIRKREAKNSLQRLLESNIPYGDDSITCADSRRFAYQTIIDRCEEEDKEVRK